MGSTGGRFAAFLSVLTFSLATASSPTAHAEDDGTDSPIRGADIQLKSIEIDADSRNRDVRGITISFRYRVGRVDTDKALFLLAFLDEGHGQLVKSTVEDWAFRDKLMNLHGKTQLLTVPRYTWQEGSLFVPFYAIKLPEGRHRLTLDFAGVTKTQSCTSGRRPQKLEVIGGEDAHVEFVKPPHKMVKLAVKRVEVVEKATDGLGATRRGRPDLAWKAFFQLGLHKGKVHSSKTRDDSYVGTWERRSGPFPFSEGDKLTVTIIDRDVLSHDLMGSFNFTLDELIGATRSAEPLSGGAVERLVLGNVEIR